MPIAAAVSGVLTQGAGSGGAFSVTIWDLFIQSLDLFTGVLVIGSFAAVAVIVRAVLDIRASRFNDLDLERTLREHLNRGDLRAAARVVDGETTFVARVLDGCLRARKHGKRAAIDAAEMTASAECARWFRKIEPLSVIGNLGPLVGLAGTVWGMIIAFAELGESGGVAGPAQLSVGISKALFHTLLGLVLAVPCLTVFGFYRGVIDKLCTGAMATSSGLVERAMAIDPDAGETSEGG